MSSHLTKLLLLAVGIAVGHFWSKPGPPPALAMAEAKGSGGGLGPSLGSAAPAVIQQGPRLSEWEGLSETLANRVKRLTAKMSRAEIEAEVRKLESQPNAESSRLRTELMRAWARLDVDSAWKYALEQTKPYDRQYLLEAVAGELAKTQPQEALQRALALNSPALRKSALRKVFEDWTQADPKAAIGYWNSHPELPSDLLGMSAAFSALARTQPALAAELALSCRTTGFLSTELTSALRPWVERDAGAVARWAASMTDPALRDKALAAAAQALMAIDPKQAWEVAAKVASASAAKDLTGKLLNTWMDQDPVSAIKYLAGLPEAEAKAYASSVGFVVGQMAPAEQRQLLSSLPEGGAKASLRSTLVRSNSQAGRYTDAISLLNEMPDGQQRDQSLHSLAGEWAAKDPAATLKWIRQQPDSSDRDLALAAYSANLARNDPRAAVQMTGDIPDKVVQKGALKNIYYTWLRADAGAANAWLDTVPTFTAAEKKMARQIGPSMGRIGSLFLPAPSVGKGR